ncbi:MAG: tripartite tricarboxylate transporter TctB family protein [Burkholderiales bacterium]|nr:MAG: tripartite tricarboxylate transporter TctB family protein [Burkholderiales bacterium]
MTRGAGPALAELALSLAVLALGAFVAYVAAGLPGSRSYSAIGANFMPIVVGAGLILLGIWLLAEHFSGGWRAREPDDAAERGEHPFEAGAFAWVSGGLFAQMALIHTAGFVLAATALFACVARGYGSRRPARDAALGVTLGLAVFLFFVKFLNVNLPAGWLKPVLGGAGI